MNVTRAGTMLFGAFDCRCFTMPVVCIAGGDNFRLVGEERVAATVVGMIMRAEDVAHRLIRDAANPRHDLGVVLIVLVIYQDDALIRNVDGHITAIADGHIKVVADLLDGEGRRRYDLRGQGRDDAYKEHHCAASTHFERLVHRGYRITVAQQRAFGQE